YLGVPYREIVIAAIIPAFLYYLSLFWMVDLEAAREGLWGLSRDKLPQFGPVLRESGHLAVPLLVIVALLLYGWSPLKSCFYGIVALLVVTFLHPATRSRCHPANLARALQDGVFGAM